MVTPKKNPTDPRKEADEFAGRFIELFGDDVRSVVLYGSAARGEYRSGVSDINLLVILRELGLPELRRAAPLAREWVAVGNPPPLMLSDDEWAASADAFPLEYSDIRASHLLLHGADPFGAIEIRRGDLRLQLEKELRTRKIQLREAYLAAGIVPEEMGAVLRASLPAFLALLRGVLRLSGREAPADSPRLIGEVGALVGFDPGPLLETARGRNADAPLDAPIDGALAQGFLIAVERTVDWLDRFENSPDLPELI